MYFTPERSNIHYFFTNGHYFVSMGNIFTSNRGTPLLRFPIHSFISLYCREAFFDVKNQARDTNTPSSVSTQKTRARSKSVTVKSRSGVFQKDFSCIEIAVFGDRHAVAVYKIKAIAADLVDIAEINDEASVGAIKAFLRQKLEHRDERAAAGEHAVTAMEIKLRAENFNI